MRNSSKLKKYLIGVIILERRIPWIIKVWLKGLKKRFFRFLWKIQENKFFGLHKKRKHRYYTQNFNYDFKKSDGKPNVLLIVMDTVRAQDLPMYGGNAKMPFLSNFAKKSTVYQNAYSVANHTIPSHTSIFTGLYPFNHNVKKGFDKLDEKKETLAEILKNNGYKTVCVTDNYLICPENNISKGFEYYFHTHHEFGGSDKKAIKISKKLKGKPFFLFVNLMTSHLPYMINPSFFKNLSKKEIRKITTLNLENEDYSRKILPNQKSKLDYYREMWHKAYLSSLNYLDFQLARLMYTFSKKGLLKNTLVIITSDHGEEIFNHQIKLNSDSAYILEHYSSYNTTLKVPLIVRHIKKNKPISNYFISNIDLFPLILEETGISFKKNVDGTKEKRECIFSENVTLGGEALIFNNHKLIKNNMENELYNLDKDPDETDNISEDNPEIVNKLNSELEKIKLNKKDVNSEKLKKNDEEEMKKRLKSLGYI